MSMLATRRNALKLVLVTGALAFSGGRALASKGTLERIKKEGVWRIGIDANFPPFGQRDAGGKIIGYDLDLATLFCKTLGVEPRLMDTQWTGIIPSLYAGHFDIIMAGIGHTKDRAAKVAFTIPYAEASQRLLIRASDRDKIKSIEDISGRVVGIKLGSVAEVIIKTLNPQIEQARGKGFSVKIFDDLNPAYLALAQGSVDAVLNSIAPLSVVLRDRPNTYALVPGNVGTDIWVGIAARKDDTDIIEFLNKELMRLRKNGQLYELHEKWFRLRMQLPDVLPNPGL